MTLEYRCNLLKELLQTRKEKKFIDEFLDIQEIQENFPAIYSLYEDKLLLLSIKIIELKKHLYNISPRYRDQCEEYEFEIDSIISIIF